MYAQFGGCILNAEGIKILKIFCPIMRTATHSQLCEAGQSGDASGEAQPGKVVVSDVAFGGKHGRKQVSKQPLMKCVRRAMVIGGRSE